MFLKKYFRFVLLLSLFSGLVLLSANAMSSKDAGYDKTSEILLGGHGKVVESEQKTIVHEAAMKDGHDGAGHPNHDSNHMPKSQKHSKSVDNIVSELTAIHPEDALFDENLAPSGGYMIGSGDEVRVIVFGEPNLTNIFRVSDFGTIAMPLIGQVNVGGLTVTEAEQVIVAQLKDGYLRNPKVSLEIREYGSFYILGEVRNPGVYEYKAGMNVLNAVAIAGGYTYRAEKDEVELLSPNKAEGAVVDVPASSEVKPGDIILIKERFF